MNTSAAMPPILLVEDNPMDLDLTLRAFSKKKFANQIQVARDGEEALAFLPRWEAGEALPAVILLDINLPKVNGLEVLRQLKAHERYRRIPVVVLTSSTEPSDLQRAYEAGTNAYIAKPTEFAQFLSAMKHVCEFWVNINQPAPQSASAGVRTTSFGELA